jgi:hypothetical protein
MTTVVKVRMPGARRATICLALGIAAAGCAATPAPQTAVPAAPAPASYDGHYEGTVQVTGAASGTNPELCAVNPRMSVDVVGNRFTYSQPHATLAGSSARGLTADTTPVYTATIGRDGSISGVADATNATMAGRVSGTRMSGQIYGLLCYYSFSADRR